MIAGRVDNRALGLLEALARRAQALAQAEVARPSQTPSPATSQPSQAAAATSDEPDPSRNGRRLQQALAESRYLTVLVMRPDLKPRRRALVETYNGR